MSVEIDTLKRPFKVLVVGATLLLGMTACVAAPPMPTPPATVPKAEKALPTSAPSEAEAVTADADFASLDGLTSGRVEVVLEDRGRTAVVRLVELTTPHSLLGIGGSLQPRGEDPCFDEGLRSEGGSFAPSKQVGLIRLPGDVDGEPIREIDLFISGESNQVGCINRSVARASLDWNQSMK